MNTLVLGSGLKTLVVVQHDGFVGMPTLNVFISPYHHFRKESADVLSQVTSGDVSTAVMQTN